MQALKIATIAMGVLIVLGTAGLVIGIARKSSTPSTPPVATLPASVRAVLDEPVGTRITGIATVRDRLALQLQGGGTDRVVLIDPTTGSVTGRILLSP